MRGSTKISVFAAFLVLGCSERVSGPLVEGARTAFHMADLRSVTLESSASMMVPSPFLGSSGISDLYPSTIEASGIAGTVATVVVQLRGVRHTFPDDFDVILVGPSGQGVKVMSDVGGSLDVNGVTLTIDDAAAEPMPDRNIQLVSGAYQPSNIDVSTDNFPSPAPAGPYATTLSAFAGTNPNGAWRLFAMDDEGGDFGAIEGGWTLQIVYRPNELPLVDAGGPYTVVEGSAASVMSTGSDADGDSFSLAWDLDNDGTFETSGATGSVSYPDNGVHSIVARAVDEHGADGSDAATVIVSNAVPVIEPISNTGGLAAVSIPVRFSDAGVGDAPWTIEVEWGDETSTSTTTTTQATPTIVSHLYAGEGSRTARARVKDKDGDSSEWASFTVTTGDATAPLLSVVLSGARAAGVADWYNSAVNVDWTFSDPESGIAAQSVDCADVVDDSQTAQKTLTCTVTNGIGLTTTQTATYRIDRAAPTIVINGARAYGLTEIVNISCNISDAGAGVASQSCPTMSLPAYLFSGSRSLTATAKDKAGNRATETASFSVTVTTTSTCALVRQFVSKTSVENALCKRLENAAKHAKKSSTRGKARDELKSFVREVVAQTGKSISIGEALILVKVAASLAEELLH